jgi:hypothetical protein
MSRRARVHSLALEARALEVALVEDRRHRRPWRDQEGHHRVMHESVQARLDRPRFRRSSGGTGLRAAATRKAI